MQICKICFNKKRYRDIIHASIVEFHRIFYPWDLSYLIPHFYFKVLPQNSIFPNLLKKDLHIWKEIEHMLYNLFLNGYFFYNIYKIWKYLILYSEV